MKKSKTHNERIIDIAGILTCLGITLGVHLFALSPLLAQRAVAGDTRHLLKLRRAEGTKLNNNLLSLKKHTIAARETLGQSGIQLSSADTINQQIAELTDLLATCRLTIDDVQTGRIMMGKRCDLVPIRISGKGRYDRFVYFLHKLSLDLPDVCVADMDMQGIPERPGEDSSFIFDLFWFAAPSLS